MLVRFRHVPDITDHFDALLRNTILPVTVERTQRNNGFSLRESNDQLTVTLELPGVAKNDITVNVREGHLTITAERKRPELNEQEQWIRNEMNYGTYERTLRLPYAVDVEKVTAVHENGLLTVVLPKHEIAKPKQITVR
ncbi:MAG: Hsp20/alpha crystallin family protein [Bacteroidetes bacterium]|nr:Hsp20/alpha crystallin family protein [Bacteroidota bacterium]